MTDTDVDYGPDDPSEFILRGQRSTVAQGMSALGEDPEKAARAVELGDATGDHPALIYANLDNYEAQHKASLTGQLLNSSKYLRQYIDADPMHVKVSADDFGQLDLMNTKLSDLVGKDTPFGKWLQRDEFKPSKSFGEGFGSEPVGASVLSKPGELEWALSHPEIAAVGMAIATPVELLSRTASGIIHLGHDGLQQMFGKSFADEMAAMAEWSMMRGDLGVKSAGMGPLERMQQNAKLQDTMRSAAQALELSDPWTKIGREPPEGIHPLIDKAKELQAKEDIRSLDDALSEAQKSATRERSPEFFANFLRGPLAEREIGISSEAVRGLYGDKVPEVGDNVLGWVPDIEKRLAAAELTGEDIRIPTADWLAKVDPEVAKALHDDIRVREDSPTLNDIKIEAEPKTTGPDISQQIRGSAGLEPMFSVGDRKVELRRVVKEEGERLTPERLAAANGEEITAENKGYYENQATSVNDQTGKFGLAQGFHDLDIHDETGQKIGTINISEQKGGKQLYIDMIQAGSEASKFYQPNYLGPSTIRDIGRQLKQLFPKAFGPDGEGITGHRVSGAREKAETYNQPHATPKVKFEQGENPQKFRDLIGAYWEQTQRGDFQTLRGERSLDQQVLSQAIEQELRRILPLKLDTVDTPLAIRQTGSDAPTGGLYQRFTNNFPTIAVALEGGEARMGTARHEAIHHLRNYGFFKPEEWATLERAARDEGWIEKHNIDKRYPDTEQSVKLEEAIAEGYRTWKDGAQANDKVHPIFEKLKQFFEAIKTRLKELTGSDLAWESIFKKVDEGEIGAREGTKAIDEAPFDMASVEEFRRAANDNEKKIAELKRTLPTAAEARERGDAFLKELDRRGTEINDALNQPESELGNKRIQKLQASWNDLFDRGADNFDPFNPKASIDDEGTGGFGLYDRGKALGVTQSHMDRMLRLIEKRNAEDLAASERRAELRQRRRSNKDYKDRRTTLRDEVSTDLRQRPDLALDELLTKQKLKINPAYLTEDQRARLPKDYLQTKDGVNPDDLAPYFGYTSGDALVERLGILTEDRRRAGMSQRDYLNRVIDVETDRRLNQEFGNREQNILDEAKDQALSETQLDLVHEETLAYALKAGAEPQFTKEQVREMVRGVFQETPIGQISSDRLLQNSGKLGKKIEEAGAKGDWETAYRLSQQRNHTVIAAKFAREYERARSSFDRTAKQFRQREVASVPAEYMNWIHSILLSVERPINRSIQDLAENVGRAGDQTLAGFKDSKEAEWMGMRELPVAEFLLDPNFRKNLSDLTHAEFMGLKNSVDTIVKAGRDEKKIYREGEAYDREATISEMREKLETFGYKPTNVEPSTIGKWPRAFIYGLANMETILNRWDRADPRGIFNRMVARPLSSAANSKAALQREIARAYEKLSKPKGLDKLVEAPFPDPMTRTPARPEGDGPWAGFTKGHVLQMLNNAGNKSNFKTLAHGYGVEPEVLMQWLFKNTTKEDWDRAQQMGDSIFKSLVQKADNVYERMTGATVEKIQLEPIQTPYGEYKGWYHPLVADAQRKTVWVQDPETGQWGQKAQGKKESLDDSDFFHFSTSNGYTKKRTGAIYPLDLNFNMVPTRIKQMIHDISFREIIHDTQKIFGDRRFREDVSKYYGSEYADGLMPYLRAVAGAEGIPSKGLAQAAALSERLRQNVISTYIGFNPFTVMKHGPTAAVMSSREVGTGHFFDAVKTLYAQAPSVARITSDFIMKNSEEIQRRERHWQDTIAGQGREITGASNLREKVVEAGSAAVAWSDMVSAKPTWLAAYNKYLADGLSHGESVSLAERAVRRAHGSTAETNQPPLVRGGGPLHGWLTSVYGFFGTAMQRRIETAYKLNDAWKLGKEGELNAASKKLGSAFVDFMTYMVWPTIVEELVQGIGTEDHRTWGTKLISGATVGAASSVLYLRDLVHGLVSGHEPGVGMMSSALHDLGNVFRDITRGKDALNKQHAGKTVGDLITVVGESTGLTPKIVGNAARYGINVVNKQEKPKSVADVLLGVTKGTQKRRVEK